MNKLEKKLIKQYKNNVPVKKICKNLKIGTTLFYSTVRKYKIPAKKVSKVEGEHLERLKKLYYEDKKSFADIGEELEIHPHTLSRVLKRHNLKRFKKHINKSQEDKIVLLGRDGVFIGHICEQCNVATATVKKVFKQHNIKYQKRVDYSGDEIKKAKELHKKGNSPYEIAEKLGINRNRAAKLLISLGIKCHRKYNEEKHRTYPVNHDFLDVIGPKQAYTMGWFWTDGSVNSGNWGCRINLQRVDRNILELLNSFFHTNKPIRDMENKGRKYSELLIHSRKIHNRFVELGCPPSKTYILRGPKDLPEEMESHFIRGALDGDGCIYHKKNNTQPKIMFVGSKFFMKWIEKIIRKNTGIKGTFYKSKHHHKNILHVSYGSIRRCQEILQWIYKESEGLRLERKYMKNLTVQKMTGARV